MFNAMTVDVKTSFSSANVFPAKILLHERLIRKAKNDRKLMPIHVQLNPTNKCNFSCNFCSCGARNRKEELSYSAIVEVMSKAQTCGCESVTITGGGDPLMHRKIGSVVSALYDLGIAIGMVTNGVLLHRLSSADLDKFVWIRISSSDYVEDQLRQIGKSVSWWFRNISETVEKGSVDWAFSHVLCASDTDLELIESLVNFANNHSFTHVRLVNDILNVAELAGKMGEVRGFMRNNGVDDASVNYQDRVSWIVGAEKCYISLVKPVVGADGYLYPCCGTQYALANPTRDYERSMRMGLARDIDKLFEEQKCFNGSMCVKCYYSDYNWALGVLLSDIKHQKFV